MLHRMLLHAARHLAVLLQWSHCLRRQVIDPAGAHNSVSCMQAFLDYLYMQKCFICL